MSYRRPATIANDLNDRISDFTTNLNSYMDVNSLEAKRLVLDAKKLIQANAAEGHLALAQIYHLCGDVDSMRHHFDNASKLSNNLEFYGVRSACESNLGFMSEAQRFFAKVAEPTRGFLPKCFEIAIGCGAFSLLNDYIDKAEIMGIQFPDSIAVDAKRIAKVLAEAEISDIYVANLLDIAGDIMRARKISFAGSSSTMITVENGNDPYVVYGFTIRLPGDCVAEMSEELADRIARSPLPIYDQFSVTFRPL